MVILRQIKRQGRIAIYSRIRERGGKPQGFEVINIRLRSGDLGPYEAYPGARDFGRYAKAVMDMARAEEIFADWLASKRSSDASAPEGALTSEVPTNGEPTETLTTQE